MTVDVNGVAINCNLITHITKIESLGSSGEHFRFYAWLTNNSYLYFRSYAGAADYEWNYQDATLYFNSREELEAARRKIIATLDSK